MSALVKYEAARLALAAATSVDEVKDLRDKASAMAAYARQAQDTELILLAQELKVRAERKVGEMLVQSAQAGARQTRGKPKMSHDATFTPSLEEIGITRDQSSRWQSIASIPDDRFESVILDAKRLEIDLTSALLLRVAKELKQEADGKAKAAMPPTIREQRSTGSSEHTEILESTGPTASKPSLRARADEDSSENDLVSEHVADGSTPTDSRPKVAPTSLELANRARDEALEAVEDMRGAVDELQAEVEAYRSAEAGEGEKALVAANLTIVKLQGEIRRLESIRDGWMNKCNEAIREVKKLRRQLERGHV